MGGAPPQSRALFDLLESVCLDARGREKVSDLALAVSAHGLSAADGAALGATGARLGVYRALVRNNLARVLFRVLERSRELVNAHHNDLFDDTVVRFLNDGGPRSARLRDVPGEFTRFAGATWRQDASLPAWPHELTTLELARFQAMVCEDDEAVGDAPELHLQSRFVAAKASQLHRFTYSVLSALEGSDLAPAEAETYVAVCRDDAFTVHAFALTAAEHTLASALMSGTPLGDAVAQLTVTGTNAAAHLEDAARLLSRLSAAGLFSLRR